MFDTTDVSRSEEYCPIARGAEIFAERWTPVIVRNLHMGCETFSEIRRNAPGISKTLLTQRLRQLARAGVVHRIPKDAGRGWRYTLTPAGDELWEVCDALGRWGARWLESAPVDLDPGVALWSMCNALRSEELPAGRLVVRFEFTDRAAKDRLFWLVVQDGHAEICVTPPGFAEDVWVRTDSATFMAWQRGHLTWDAARAEGTISTSGAPSLVRAFARLGVRRRPTAPASPP